MRNTKKLFMLVAVILALVLSACSNGASSEQAQDAGSMDNQESTAVDLASLGIDCSEYSAEYAKGPNGEDAVPASDVTLTMRKSPKFKQEITLLPCCGRRRRVVQRLNRWCTSSVRRTWNCSSCYL